MKLVLRARAYIVLLLKYKIILASPDCYLRVYISKSHSSGMHSRKFGAEKELGIGGGMVSAESQRKYASATSQWLIVTNRLLDLVALK